MKTINFFGLDLADLSFEELMRMVSDHLSSTDSAKYVVTPNPEMYVEAEVNPSFFEALKAAWLRLPDGFGIQLYSRFVSGAKLKNRLTGVDFTSALLNRFPNEKFFLLGGARGAAEKLSHDYGNVVSYFNGIVNEDSNERIINEICGSGATVLLVALGAPKQELWMYDNLKNIPELKLAVGVGGSLDFLAGIQVRAPKLMRKLGIEWLWRLFREPKRLRRIYNAVMVFSCLVFKKIVFKK